MSLTCHEKVGRVGRGRYEMLATCPKQVVLRTSRACRSGGIWSTTRHADKRAAALYTTADRRLTNQVSAWQSGRGSCPTRATSS